MASYNGLKSIVFVICGKKDKIIAHLVQKLTHNWLNNPDAVLKNPFF